MYETHVPVIAPCARQAGPLCAALRHPRVHPKWALQFVQALGAVPDVIAPTPAGLLGAAPHRLLALERDVLALPILRLME